MEKLILTGVDHPWTFELVPGLNTVGRNPTNEFCLHEASVSSFHCEITVRQGSVLVNDLGSTNGTFIDGARITEGAIRPGQTLLLGTVALRLTAEPIIVAIPQISVPELPTQTFLADGVAACLNHPGVPAVYRCGQCGAQFCPQCVRQLARTGGATMIFCPSCPGQCATLPPKPVSKPAARSFFGRLTQTLKLTFTGKK